MSEAFKLAPHEWALLRSLLDEALALPPGRRADWLEALDDARSAGLKPRLQSLLANAADAGDSAATAARLLDTLPKVETGQFAPLPGAAAEQPGDTVGPYRLIRELGSGGMGSVWLAERTDMLQGRQVALKLPHGAWKRAGLAERMAREREILATLEHPNIARLYDAGVAAGGQPWMALEYVEGQRIDVHCRARALPVRERLRLFVQVAQAVAHAHAHLVVHRDLKPANILVTADGSVKLLDFGIAKLVAEGTAGSVVEETALTREVGGAFTPEYASPEQVLRRPLGTASDIYSLGVVLFELLAERRPYELPPTLRASRAALEDAVARADVPRPSAVAPPERRGALRGDLDAIVAKALKPVPEQRYATAAALLDDLERHLQHLPVQAQPESLRYRAGRFVRRHRLGVGVGATVAIAVIGGAALALWQAGVARAEQQRAERALGFLTSIFREADPNVGPGGQPSAVQLLVRAHERVNTQLAAYPAERVEVLNVLAESLIGVDATEAADRVSLEALEAARALHGEGHAQTLRARVARVSVMRSFDDRARWRAEFDAVWPALQAAPARHLELLLQAGIHGGELALSERRFDDAERLARSLLVRAELPDAGPRHAERAELMKIIAVALDGRGQIGPAIDASREAVRQAEAAFGDRPHHPALINKRQLLARQLAYTDGFDEALALMARSVDDAAANYGPESAAVGQFLQNLAAQSARVGRLREAEQHAIRALAVLQRHYGPEEPHLMAAYDALAFVHMNARRGEAALPLYDRMLAVERGPRYVGLEREITLRMRRAAALGWLGRLDEARSELDFVARTLPRNERTSLTWPLLHRAMVERVAGRPAEALVLLEQSLAAVRPTPLAVRERLFVRTEIGIGLSQAGRHDEALTTLTGALSDWKRMKLHPTPQHADALLALGRSRLALGQGAAAREALAEADGFWRDFAPGSAWAGEAAHWLARALAAGGQASEAADARARGRSLLAGSTLPVHRALLAAR